MSKPIQQELPLPRPARSRPVADGPADAANMFLHLRCEGWVAFGPFEWLGLQDNPLAIVDQSGAVVASWDGQVWRTTDPQYSGYAWRSPMITVGPRRPS